MSIHNAWTKLTHAQRLKKADYFINKIDTLYNTTGRAIKIGNLSLLEHSIMTARNMGHRTAGNHPAMLTGLLHDIGYMLAENEGKISFPFHHGHHCKLGSIYLHSWGFPSAITKPIKLNLQIREYIINEEIKSVYSGSNINNQKKYNLKKHPWFEHALELYRADEDAFHCNHECRSILEFKDCFHSVLGRAYDIKFSNSDLLIFTL